MSTQNLKSPHSSRRKRVIIIVIIIVVLLAGGVAAYFLLGKNTTKQQGISKQTSDKTSMAASSSRVNSVSQEAHQAANGQGGSIDKAVAVYDDAIKNTPSSDTATTSALYYNKSSDLYNAHKYDDALAAALRAAQLQPDAMNYGLLGDIYKAQGDKPHAIDSYKKALTFLSSMPNDGAGKAAMTRYDQQQIDELEKS